VDCAKLLSSNIRNFISQNDLASRFQNSGIAIIPNFLSDEGQRIIFHEVANVLPLLKRRNFTERTYGTDRIMNTIGSRELFAKTTYIQRLYESLIIRTTLGNLAGEAVFLPADENERVVINRLSRKNDVHGGHVDTYSFAFNIVVEAPPIGSGGELLVAKGSLNPEDLAGSDVDRYSFLKNDAYFLRTDASVHGVAPLTGTGFRTIINMAYASAENKDAISYSSDSLYG